MPLVRPGRRAEGYRVISLTLAPQSFVRSLSLIYPDSEIYYFEPLDERVPVYQKPSRLLQEVVLENRPDGSTPSRLPTRWTKPTARASSTAT